MRCLETRTTAEGFKRRRYEDRHGTRSTTIEIPVALFNQLVAASRADNDAPQVKLIANRSKDSTRGVDLQSAWRAT